MSLYTNCSNMIHNSYLRKKISDGNIHPFTELFTSLCRYNTLDQLVCVLCNTVIKSNILWNAHIQGRQHKEVS